VAILWLFIHRHVAHPAGMVPFKGSYFDTSQKQEDFPQPEKETHIPRGKRTSVPQQHRRRPSPRSAIKSAKSPMPPACQHERWTT
jgi:hypothetical protein